MLKWKYEYIIGIQEIDVQHEELFNIANKAYRALNDTFSLDKYDEIITIIEELKEYAIYHFKSEEEYMKSIHYKKIFSHKIEHDEFIEKVNNVDLRKVDDNQDKYLLEILDFIVEWTSEHILKIDKKITATSQH